MAERGAGGHGAVRVRSSRAGAGRAEGTGGLWVESEGQIVNNTCCFNSVLSYVSSYFGRGMARRTGPVQRRDY